ncbi:MAG TPA: hypothetical protein VFV34_01505 [Blastocatellia bacterium]|nr:hypothetical protein [Blastocatellia bacterium]
MNQVSRNKISVFVTVAVGGMSLLGAGFAVYVIAPRLLGDRVAMHWLALFGIVLIGALVFAFAAAWIKKSTRENH